MRCLRSPLRRRRRRLRDRQGISYLRCRTYTAVPLLESHIPYPERKDEPQFEQFVHHSIGQTWNPQIAGRSSRESNHPRNDDHERVALPRPCARFSPPVQPVPPPKYRAVNPRLFRRKATIARMRRGRVHRKAFAGRSVCSCSVPTCRVPSAFAKRLPIICGTKRGRLYQRCTVHSPRAPAHPRLVSIERSIPSRDRAICSASLPRHRHARIGSACSVRSRGVVPKGPRRCRRSLPPLLCSVARAP
mmetsp:Transcript_19874/g.43166  ORF Transcript_19874/g.43166 Transcript_19874/m.43166 type:complete len:246 (+) Transcript_19874:1353-2090(+)